MQAKNLNATGERIAGRAAADRGDAVLLDVKEVATLLNCSSRHVYRLSDSGRMPRPVKVGSLCRWSRTTVLDWIERGCPRCRREATI
jgi:excisionase family DNA binding protein